MITSDGDMHLTGASNAKVYEKSRFSANVSLYLDVTMCIAVLCLFFSGLEKTSAEFEALEPL